MYTSDLCVCCISEGEDALIVACEDDHYVVVAGTFEKLVEQLACEEKPGTPNVHAKKTLLHNISCTQCIYSIYIHVCACEYVCDRWVWGAWIRVVCCLGTFSTMMCACIHLVVFMHVLVVEQIPYNFMLFMWEFFFTVNIT